MGIPLSRIIVGIKGAGEVASAVAHRLYMASIRRIFMMEIRHPLAVRRKVSFCEAARKGKKRVEGVEAVFVKKNEIERAWKKSKIALINDPEWKIMDEIEPDVEVDAILAKKNLGTRITDAPIVIALGPGFYAGKEAHYVVETNRGHNLGRLIAKGFAASNTGIPGNIAGYSAERVLRSPDDGIFYSERKIGDCVKSEDFIGNVGKEKVTAGIGGIVRGLLRSGDQVYKGLKIGDIDPRNIEEYCTTISDKARAVSGSVLEAILRKHSE